MTEDFLHYIWQYHIPLHKPLKGTNDETIIIYSKGEKNTNAGPDFFNAKISINSRTWAGNIEIHIHASDWEEHTHQIDMAYNNVILHVVRNANKTIQTSSGRTVSCLALPEVEEHYKSYIQHFSKKTFIPCEQHVSQIDKFSLFFWLEKIMIERWENFYKQLRELLLANKNDWESVFYQLLVQNFGLIINKEPFVQLARSLSMKILARHKDNLLQIEALLFGQAGFLENEHSFDDYYIKLRREYLFLRHKYKLKNIHPSQWKFLRLRPANFPTIRIAQLAALIYHSFALLSTVIETDTLKKLRPLLDCKASVYWDSHYDFGKKSKQKRNKRLGKQMQDLLLINSILPIIFSYGLYYAKSELQEKSLRFLNQLPSEKNHIITAWEKTGIKSSSAFYSQALLQLKKNYCNFNRCLQCAVGHQILKDII